MIFFLLWDVIRFVFVFGVLLFSFDVFFVLGIEVLVGMYFYEVNLGEGDVFFFLVVWFYIVVFLIDMSVVVNVFFCDLSSGYVEGWDVYGNWDLFVYEKGW